ncbi:uncharacterized protein LOC127745006 [Arachis duranensis]|uniref:Uncharacterized protein LOC127745006 n=1 Tax=Arachis duranensis TaxID=130453 RepID=A0A9C6WLA5_ARADU|nr:uncharacterized protein LOC127745006 [Arachis duranensis]
MDKNNTSNSNPSVCNKIRQAIASNPAIRIINRISSYNQEPKHAKLGSISTSSPSSSPSSSSSPSPNNNTPIQIQTKPHIPQQQEKGNHKEASPRTIPIKFEYSTPPKENIHGQAPKSSPPFAATNLQSATNKDHGQEHHHHHHHRHDGMHQEQQGKKSMMNIDETFNEYIQRAKKKIRTMSNIGRGHNSIAEDHESHGGGTNEKDHHQHRDQFSEFINRAKKKIRTTTIVGKSSSLRKGLQLLFLPRNLQMLPTKGYPKKEFFPNYPAMLIDSTTTTTVTALFLILVPTREQRWKRVKKIQG